MVRILCLALISFVAFATPVERAEAIERQRRAAQFDLHWGTYLRKLFGCPLEGPVDRTTCIASAASTDYAEFAKARKLAKQIFDLQDPK